MKILFILPRYNKDRYIYDPRSTEPNYTYMPVGMPSIVAVLKKAGYPVDVQNQNNKTGLIEDMVREKLQDTKYDIVFTGALSLMFPNIRDIIRFIRKYSPGTKVVVGGGIVSAQPEIMFDLLKPDIEIIFEGEDTCLELVQWLNGGEFNLHDINGICYADKDGIRVTPSREPVKDLDSLPYPDWDAFGIDDLIAHTSTTVGEYCNEELRRPYSIITSRGCAWNCSFCFHTTGKGYRVRSVPNIMAELKWAFDNYRINYLYILDELMSLDKPRAMELYRQLAIFCRQYPWRIQIYMGGMRVDRMDDEMVLAVRDIPAEVTITLGLESYSRTVLKSMKKGITPEQIESCLTKIASHNLLFQGSFIFGDPAETLETAKETLDFFEKRQDIIRGCIDIDFVMPFASTGVYKHCVEKGIIRDEAQFILDRAEHGIDSNDPINMTNFSTQDFSKLVNMVRTSEYVARRFARPVSEFVADGCHHVRIRCPWCGEITTLTTVDKSIADIGDARCVCENPECKRKFFVGSKWNRSVRLLAKAAGIKRCHAIMKKGIELKKKVLP